MNGKECVTYVVVLETLQDLQKLVLVKRLGVEVEVVGVDAESVELTLALGLVGSACSLVLFEFFEETCLHDFVDVGFLGVGEVFTHLYSMIPKSAKGKGNILIVGIRGKRRLNYSNHLND